MCSSDLFPSHDNTGQFITLTFSNEELEKLINETGIQESNAVATLAVRRFLERRRKKYKESVKHWFVTELGHNGTERIHLHGILFTKETKETIESIWKYGNIWVGTFVNTKTINYIIILNKCKVGFIKIEDNQTTLSEYPLFLLCYNNIIYSYYNFTLILYLKLT